MKTRIETDTTFRSNWERQYKRAVELTESDRLNTSDLSSLGLAYRMTGEDRFGDAIKKILYNSLKTDSWTKGGLLNRTPPWKGGLNTAEAAHKFAVGYDCAYNYFTKAEQKELADGLMRLGITPLLGDWMWPESSFHTFDTMGHNWWSVCVCMGGLGALAIRNEIPEAEAWAKEIEALTGEWMNFTGSILQNKPSTFDKDGGFFESISYSSYGISNFLEFRKGFQNVFPNWKMTELPILEHVPDFYIYTTYYTSEGRAMSTHFGDSQLNSTGGGCVKSMWDMGYQKDRFAWYLNKVNSPREGGRSRGGGRGGSISISPERPKLSDDYVPDLPTSHLFADMGWATMRNSWEDNATMLGVKCGFTWNHTHADAGSYVLFHNGKNLIVDGGNCSYGSPLYSDYYCQSEAHNVVFFNGEAQNRRDPYYGVVHQGSLHNLIDGGDFKYLMANATGPYAHILDRNYRHFVWVGDVILVIDDLLARESGKFDWLLHYNGESKRSELNLSIKQDDAEILIHPLYPETFPEGGLPHDFPEQMRLEEKWGYEDHHPDTREAYWSISQVDETIRTKFVTAIILKTDENKDNLPNISRFKGNDFLGVSITQNGETTQLYLNLLADGRLKHRNSVINMNGWETDALLTVLKFKEGEDITKMEAVDEVFIGHGSYLRKDGEVLLHSLSKYTSLVQNFGTLNQTMDIHGQPQAIVRVHADKKQSQIKVNGKIVNGNYETSGKLLKLNLRNEQ